MSENSSEAEGWQRRSILSSVLQVSLPSEELSDDEALRLFMRRLSVRVAQFLGILLTVAVVAVWPSDFFIFDRNSEEFRDFAGYRASIVLVSIVFLLLSEIVVRHAHRFYWVVFVGFWAGASVLPFFYFGDYLADPTKPFFYSLYTLPTITILLLFPLGPRIVATILLPSTWLFMQSWLYPNLVDDHTFGVILVFAGFLTACCIFLGHGFYLLVCSNFLRQRQILVERRRVDEVNEQLSRLFANVSHELRTPVTVIRGSLHRLSEFDTGDGALTRWAAGLERNTARLSVLVDQLLSISRRGGEAVQPNAQDVVVEELVAPIIQAVYAGVRDSATASLTARSAGIVAHVDPVHLADMIFNLISNARKFSEAEHGGEGNVSVVLETVDDHCVIHVSDNGPGIEQNAQGRLFERFSQVHDEATLQLGGVGLGLSIVAELARLNDGWIGVHSVIGQGTCFSLHLPLGQGRPACAPTAPQGASLVDLWDQLDTDALDEELSDARRLDTRLELFRAMSSTRGRVSADMRAVQTMVPSEQEGWPVVFVVDDEEDMLDHILDTLRDEPVRVFGYTSPVSALEALADLSPQLIVTDLMMRPMDGAQFVRKIRSLPHWHRVPMMVVSADHELGPRVELLESGAVDFMTKPFHREEFVARVRRHLEVGQWTRELDQTVRELERAQSALGDAARAVEAPGDGPNAQQLAQVLHDDLGQLIAACSVEVTVAEHADTVHSAFESLRRLRLSIAALTQSFRATLRALTANALPDPSMAQLRAAILILENYVDVDVHDTFYDDVARLEPAARDVVIRIVQEAFTNALRHASASTVSAEFHITETTLELVISDDGCGMDAETLRSVRSAMNTDEVPATPSGHGMGLAGMRRRLVALGGSLHIDAHQGVGTELRVVLPRGHSAQPVVVISPEAHRT